MREDVRKRIIEVARTGETITYKELMQEFGIPRGNPKRGIGIGDVVGEISEYEYSRRRPLVSAIVVRSDSDTKICPKGHPGGGFFGLPGIPSNLKRDETKFDDPLTEEDQKFLMDEQKKIWEFWKA